jgi:hypothetical protein
MDTDLDTEVDIMEVEDRDLEKEGELLWKTPLDKVPDLPYLKKDILPWTKGPPIIPDNHFTKFGEKILELVKNDLLTKWILDRSSLYAILGDHFYPRELDTQSGRANLAYKIAKDPLELEWAAAWLIYKRMGGLLDQREVNEFPCEIEGRIPEEYQKLQEIEDDKQYKFATGQITMKRRIIQISQDQNDLLKWIGMNQKATNGVTAAIKVINQKLNYLKLKVDPDPKSKQSTNSGKNTTTEKAGKKKDLIGTTERLEAQSTKEYESLKKELETVKKELSDLSDKTETLFVRDRDRVKKNLARRFYRLRQRIKKKLKPPKTVANKTITEEEDEGAQEEEEEMANKSF